MLSKLLDSRLDTKLKVVETIAERRDKEYGFPYSKKFWVEIENGFLTLAVVYPDGWARYTDGTTTNLKDRDYVEKAFEGVSNLSNIIISRVTNKPTIMVAVPIKRDGKVVGALIARMDGTELINLTNDISYKKNGYVLMVDSNSTIVAHKNSDYVTNSINIIKEAEKDNNFASLSKIIKNIIDNETTFGEYIFNNEEFVISSIKIEKSGWFLLITAPKKDIFESSGIVFLRILVMAIVFFFIGVVFSIFLSKSIIKPIKSLENSIDDLLSGNGDLSKRIEVSSKDEIAILVKKFNLFLDSLNVIIKDIKKSIIESLNIGSSLATSSEESSSAIEEITAHIESMKNGLNGLNSEISNSYNNSLQINGLIDNIKELIDSQSVDTNKSSSSVEEMTNFIQNVVTTSEEKLEIVNNLKDTAISGQKIIDETINVINKATNSSNSILEIVNVINDIASRTNLYMN